MQVTRDFFLAVIITVGAVVSLLMDPHSRLSQFNQRGPKAGPNIVHNRQMEMRISRDTLENFAKKAASAPSTRETTPFASRPIATNSRVRKDEKYRKDMYLVFVNNALQQKKLGKCEPFEELVNQFNPKKLASDPITATTQLRLWMSALSHVVSQLDRSHAALVDAIVSLPWTTMDSAFAKSYISFLSMLVSARPEYALRVLEETIQGLTHQSGLQALNTGLPESSTNPLTRREVYERLHSLLQQLLSLMPTLSNTLQPILTRYFPHKRQSHVAQVTYIRNLLQISEYCPELCDGILALIVDRTIQIDVEIQVELEELEEAPEDGHEMFPIDLFDNVVGQDGDESDSDSDLDPDEDGLGGLSDVSSDAGCDGEGGHADLPADVKRVQDMVAKLDSILTVVFDYFNRTHTASTLPVQSSSPSDQPSSDVSPADISRAPSPLSVERASALRRARFNALLAIFDRTILRTFKSRYTQFLIFWYSSLDPEFADTFQGFLAQRALVDTTTPTVTRAAAASYIASYVSRAQFVGSESARAVVSLLCRFLSNHLDVHDAAAGVESNQSQSAIQHAIFYAAAQALFLIFCFRWRDLLENDDNDEEELGLSPLRRKWMPQLDVVQRVVSSPLNPLKVCSTNVVQQFARVAQHVGFVYVYSIIEANRRSDYLLTSSMPSLSVSSDKTVPPQTHPGTRHLASTSNQVDADLTMFFPFDPYKLPKSSSYIQGVYREWSSVAIDDEDEEDDGDDDDEEEGEDYAEGSLGAPISSSYDMRDDTGGLGQSFGGMSISPIRPRQLTLAI